MSKFDRNRIKDGWEKLCTNKQTNRQTDRQTDTTKIMVTWPLTNIYLPTYTRCPEIHIYAPKIRESRIEIWHSQLPVSARRTTDFTNNLQVTPLSSITHQQHRSHTTVQKKENYIERTIKTTINWMTAQFCYYVHSKYTKSNLQVNYNAQQLQKAFTLTTMKLTYF